MRRTAVILMVLWVAAVIWFIVWAKTDHDVIPDEPGIGAYVVIDKRVYQKEADGWREVEL